MAEFFSFSFCLPPQFSFLPSFFCLESQLSPHLWLSIFLHLSASVSTFHYSSSLHSICPLHWSLRSFREPGVDIPLAFSLSPCTCNLPLLQPVSVILGRSVNTFTLSLCLCYRKNQSGGRGSYMEV